jgi:hypothetical protein
VLPVSFGQGRPLLVNPHVCGFFATGGAKPALASKRNDFGMRAIFSSATIGFVPPDCSATAEDVNDIIDDGRANMASVFLIEIPPEIVCFQKGLNRAWGANIFTCC